MKYLVVLLVLTGCGSGGGSDRPACNEEYPLFCEDAGACCTAGKPYFCDGYCYNYVPNRCVQLDLCEWE